MKASIHWDEKYCIGSVALDSQHELLVTFINSIPNDMDKDTTRQTIIQIHKYAYDHIHYEEQLMHYAGFPKLTGHRFHHQILFDNLDRLSRTFFGPANSGSKIRKYLQYWIWDHFKYYDDNYKLFYQTRRLERTGYSGGKLITSCFLESPGLKMVS